MHGIINAEFGTESPHWYDHTGKVVSLVPYGEWKKGVFHPVPVQDPITGELKTHRPPTLADARKYGFLRSWSLVKKVLANRQLDDYWTTQVTKAAWEERKAALSGTCLVDNYEAYKDLIVQQASEHREEAAGAGSELHGAVAEYIKTKELPFNPNWAKACVQIEEWEKAQGLCQPLVEVGFANPALGYGGTIDRLYPEQHTIADVKTVPSGSKKRSWPYDDWPAQLAYYWKGYVPFADKPCRLLNFVVSRDTGDLIEVVDWGRTHQPDPERAWARAKRTDETWQDLNKWGEWA